MNLLNRLFVPLRSTRDPIIDAQLQHGGSCDVVLSVGAEDVPVTVCIHPRAKRLILRADRYASGFRLTVPPHASDTDIWRFLEGHRDWISKRLKDIKPAPEIVEDSLIPLRGNLHLVRISSKHRGIASCEVHNGLPPTISLRATPETLRRRLATYLKSEARKDLESAVERYASALSVSPSKIIIRDTRSRWGSCSSKRVLSFSWRLVMAPEFVLDYVAAHEVAHIIEMNHSKRYWTIVSDVCPQMDEARLWLKTRGDMLHRYRFE